jgi:hypothetical protein
MMPSRIKVKVFLKGLTFFGKKATSGSSFALQKAARKTCNE